MPGVIILGSYLNVQGVVLGGLLIVLGVQLLRLIWGAR